MNPEDQPDGHFHEHDHEAHEQAHECHAHCGHQEAAAFIDQPTEHDHDHGPGCGHVHHRQAHTEVDPGGCATGECGHLHHHDAVVHIDRPQEPQPNRERAIEHPAIIALQERKPTAPTSEPTVSPAVESAKPPTRQQEQTPPPIHLPEDTPASGDPVIAIKAPPTQHIKPAPPPPREAVATEREAVTAHTVVTEIINPEPSDALPLRRVVPPAPAETITQTEAIVIPPDDDPVEAIDQTSQRATVEAIHTEVNDSYEDVADVPPSVIIQEMVVEAVTEIDTEPTLDVFEAFQAPTESIDPIVPTIDTLPTLDVIADDALPETDQIIFLRSEADDEAKTDIVDETLTTDPLTGEVASIPVQQYLEYQREIATAGLPRERPTASRWQPVIDAYNGVIARLGRLTVEQASNLL